MPEDAVDYCHNFSVYDMNNDVIVRLGKGKKVLKAFRAWKELSDEQI